MATRMKTHSIEFSLPHYGSLLDDLIRRGYRVTTFADADPNAPHLILRHDIDVCIERAVRMAEMEADMAVSSHYFVLMRSGIYNTLEPSSLRGLKRILSLGHQVGLHLDASNYGVSIEELDKGAAFECGVLEAGIENKVSVISFHRPAPSLLGLSDCIAGRIHTYQPKFFTEMAYCSDSRGAWNHGYPLEKEAVKNGSALQLLTHPVWWVDRETLSVVDAIDRIALESDDSLRKWLGETCEPYGHAISERRVRPVN
jgi:hypothetical protein